MTVNNPFETIISKLDLLEEHVNSLIAIQQKSTSKVSHNEDELIDIAAASELLCMPQSTIHYHKKLHDLPFIKPGKRLLFNRKNLLEWVQDFNKPAIGYTSVSVEQMSRLNSRYKK